MSDWQPSERMHNLAKRRGLVLGEYQSAVSNPVGDPSMSLVDAVRLFGSDLPSAARNRLIRTVRHSQQYEAPTDINGFPATLGEFQSELRKPNGGRVSMGAYIGPASIAEYRRVFLGEDRGS